MEQITLPIYIISRKGSPKDYLRATSGQPFQSHSKKLMQMVLDDEAVLASDWEVQRLVEEEEQSNEQS